MATGQWRHAIQALAKGLKLDPNNLAMVMATVTLDTHHLLPALLCLDTPVFTALCDTTT